MWVSTNPPSAQTEEIEKKTPSLFHRPHPPVLDHPSDPASDTGAPDSPAFTLSPLYHQLSRGSRSQMESLGTSYLYNLVNQFPLINVPIRSHMFLTDKPVI